MNSAERGLPEASFRPLNNHLFQEPQPQALPWNSPETASPGWTPQSAMEEASPLASKAGPGSLDWAHPRLSSPAGRQPLGTALPRSSQYGLLRSLPRKESCGFWFTGIDEKNANEIPNKSSKPEA